MAGTLVLFGATGDLTARYLLPALAALAAAGELPEGWEVRGVAAQEHSREQFRDSARAALERFAAAVPGAARDRVVAALDYRPADVTDPAQVAAAVAGAGTPVVVYLALPPGLLPAVVSALAAAELPPGSRLVVEKPFGAGLADARRLNALVHDVVPEESVFRVDYFLGLQAVQDVLALRMANRLFEPLWNAANVERVDVVWDETLGLEGRAGYYDTAGALRDMLQNHLLQVLCLIAMELPAALDERSLRDRKVDLLRAVRSPSTGDVEAGTVRARYSAGRIGDRELPAYVDEPGVDPGRGTETFAEVTLHVDTPRWAGVPFVLRSGKGLGRERKEVLVTFRRPVSAPADPGGPAPAPDVLRLGLEPARLRLSVTLSGGADPAGLEQAELGLDRPAQDRPAYARVLLDVLHGDLRLSVRADEAEESWRIVEPVLAAWADDVVPLHEYAAGGPGPATSRVPPPPS